MLNNKKGLLQRARIAMVAIVTIMGIGGAFAMTPHHSQDAQTYGVIATVSGGWMVTAATGDCLPDNSKTCKVESTVAPDHGFVPISAVTRQDPGSFSN